MSEHCICNEERSDLGDTGTQNFNPYPKKLLLQVIFRRLKVDLNRAENRDCESYLTISGILELEPKIKTIDPSSGNLSLLSMDSIGLDFSRYTPVGNEIHSSLIEIFSLGVSTSRLRLRPIDF